MRKVFSKLHLWLSIPFGIFISLVCLTGALLVFEDEINKVFPPAVEAEAVQPAMNGERPAQNNHWKEGGKPEMKEGERPEMKEGEKAEMGERPQMDGRPEKGGRPEMGGEKAGMGERKPGMAEGGKPQMGGKHHKSRSPFFQNVVALHRWLLMRPAQRGDMTAGKFLVGLSVLMMVVVMVSGIVIWWPRKGQSWKSRFEISVKGGARKFWYQLHCNGGLYICILLLIMALTGLTWSFPWYRTLFNSLTGMEHHTLYELHTGKWGGLFSETLYFIACLVGATLPWTGYYFWWKRNKRK